MAQRTIVVWYNDTPGIDALPVGQDMYWPRTNGGACDEDWAAFLSLSPSERIAQSVSVLPATATQWIERGCGSYVEDDQWILNGTFRPDDGTTATPNPPDNSNPVTDTSDRAGWKNLGISQSSQNVS